MSAVLTAWRAFSREAAMSPTISENASFSSFVERMLDEPGLAGSGMRFDFNHSQANAGDWTGYPAKKGSRAQVVVQGRQRSPAPTRGSALCSGIDDCPSRNLIRSRPP